MEGSEILNVDNKVRQYVNMDPLKKKFFFWTDLSLNYRLICVSFFLAKITIYLTKVKEWLHRGAMESMAGIYHYQIE